MRKESDEGQELVKTMLPAVICMLKCDYDVRLPKISGRIRAQETKIASFNADDINIDISTTGIKGSPTYVKRAFRPEGRAGGEIIRDKTSREAAELILSKISEYIKDENGKI